MIIDMEMWTNIRHEILEGDKKVHRKQQHTGKRIFDRLCKECGYTGKITIVRDEIRRWKRATAEVFMSLSHPPGMALFQSARPRGQRCEAFLFCENWGFAIVEDMKKGQIPN